MDKFLSRKFLAAVTTIIATIAAMSGGAIDAPTGIGAILVAALTYIVTEGYVDARRAATITRTAATVAQTAAAVLEKAADTIDEAAKP